MSDDLKIAVLGVGMMGAFHVDALSKRVRGARVTVVNDFLADKAAEVAGSVGARAGGRSDCCHQRSRSGCGAHRQPR